MKLMQFILAASVSAGLVTPVFADDIKDQLNRMEKKLDRLKNMIDDLGDGDHGGGGGPGAIVQSKVDLECVKTLDDAQSGSNWINDVVKFLDQCRGEVNTDSCKLVASNVDSACVADARTRVVGTIWDDDLKKLSDACKIKKYTCDRD